jgi:predicted O-methyltransferase YrrM
MIVVVGLDKAQKVMSSEYDVIFVQEAIELTVDDWEALTTRLRNGKISFQQLLADCNPSTRRTG